MRRTENPNRRREARDGAQGILDMIDNFDREPDAYARGGYAGIRSSASGFDNKPGKRIPKAGVHAEIGLGHARAEFSVFDAEAKGPNAAAGIEVSLLGARAMAKAEIASASATAGPAKVTVGLSADTGVGVGVDGFEAKCLGTGVKVGRTVEAAVFGTKFELNLW